MSVGRINLKFNDYFTDNHHQYKELVKYLIAWHVTIPTLSYHYLLMIVLLTVFLMDK